MWPTFHNDEKLPPPFYDSKEMYMDKCRGRPRKYLTTEEWNKWLGNHWRHMIWKVNGMIALMVIMIGFLIAIFSVLLQKAL